MELVFQEKQLDYLGRVLDQTVTQELTAEVIVPDSCADADRVVDAFGTLLVRAEECTAGSASVSGEVQAGILFVTEAFSCPCSVPACTALKLSCEHHCPARTGKPFGLLSRS